MIPMTVPDRSGSLEDALVIRSKAALKRLDKEADLALPLHQKHTVASHGKLSDSPKPPHHSVHVDEPRRYEGGTTNHT
jgi:hypothetical protein